MIRDLEREAFALMIIFDPKYNVRSEITFNILFPIRFDVRFAFRIVHM